MLTFFIGSHSFISRSNFQIYFLTNCFVSHSSNNSNNIESNQTYITDNEANISDNSVICTGLTEFIYQNIEMEHCHEWERVNLLEPGYYLINLIIEDRVTAQTTLKLK